MACAAAAALTATAETVEMVFVPMMCSEKAPDIRYSVSLKEGMDESETKTAKLRAYMRTKLWTGVCQDGK